ncbi:tyrosine-type recombinase/integrase [Porphyrobacter sp. AAP60]|uniref:tyrosine-type recombinase/integrase n=1 Tax=Porphyrobacter sp. AAP60 TaxID=1523423 RepID=UPI0006B8CD5B|nr:site-specific integrase [Porphyrobacter sp. AAP60]KPF64258.1 hypothetical protein IP79_05860 [Porphyrobacter sp. AAP60]
MALHERLHLRGAEKNLLDLGQIVELKRADLFERVLINRLSAFEQPYDEFNAKCYAFASAVLFGALLDKRVWQEFFRAACAPVIDFRSTPRERVGKETHIRIADQIWINFSLPEKNGKAHERRWVADPLTHLILLKIQSAGPQNFKLKPDVLEKNTEFENDHVLESWWGAPESRTRYKRKDRGSTAEADRATPFDHVEVIAQAFGAETWHPDRRKALAKSFFAAAKVKWRTRMPGFLIESLLAAGQSTSLPEPHWERLMGKAAVPLNRPKKNLPNTRRWPANDPILRLMDDVLPQSRASRPTEFKKAAQALQNASMRNDLLPVERHVLTWAAARLDPSIDPRQRRKGLAPSTIRQRASVLLSMLRTSFGSDDPWLCNPRDLAKALSDGVEERGGSDTTWNHMACFLDWQNRSLGSFALTIEDRAVREANVPRAQVVTAEEYALILDSFDRQKPEGATSRILVILGFRAGLRWLEAIHLNINDLVFTASCAELHVRDNEGARTKTLAGRRVVPLHCLLEQPELDEVKAWWLHRRTEVMVLMGRVHRPRNRQLFPITDTDFYRRIKRDVEHEIKRFTGNTGAVFHDLRHSFGSYLIATLALPFDVPDEELVLPIDRSVVSHERRGRIADTLLGKDRLGLNALHAAGALLGHSGERSTLVSYFHLHDWLAGNYVSRSETMRAIPTRLAARLLRISDEAAAQASSRKRKQKEHGQTVRRKRGRPAQSDHALDAIMLGELIERGEAAFSPSLGAKVRAPLLPGNGEPSCEVLAAFLCASTQDERDLIRQHPTLTTLYGKRLARELDDIVAMTTRGRNGKSSLRFMEIDLTDRQRSVRQLTDDEHAVLAKLYHGFRHLDPPVMDLISQCFLAGYDRVRGYITVPQTACAKMITALRKAGLSAAEINVEPRARTTLIRIGTAGRMHRGYVWGILFACAAHKASASIINGSNDIASPSPGKINPQSKSHLSN